MASGKELLMRLRKLCQRTTQMLLIPSLLPVATLTLMLASDNLYPLTRFYICYPQSGFREGGSVAAALVVDLLIQRTLEGKDLKSMPDLVTIGSENPAIDDPVDATTLTAAVAAATNRHW